jgi:hypothetical protein
MNNRNFFNTIKTGLFFLVICFSLHSVVGQSTNTEYFMTTSFAKTSLNPAKRPEKGYIGIPGLTNVFVDYKTNTLNLDHFLFPGAGTNGKTALYLHDNVSYAEFMKGISDNNYLSTDINATLLGFGFYTGDLFLSFDVSARADATINLPKGLFDFTKKGLALENEEGSIYDFSHVGADVKAYTQIGVGGSYPVLNNSLVLGAKIKILLGIGNGHFDLDHIHLGLERDNWRIASQASLQAVAPGLQAVYDEDGKFKEFNMDGASSIINGSGFGFDLGATFQPGNYFDFTGDMAFMDNVTFSAALTDVGFISWNKKSISLATDYTEQVLIGKEREPINPDETEDVLDDLEDYFNDAIALREVSKNNRSGLGAKLNWGVEYALLDNKLNVGFLNSTLFNSVKTVSEFTIAGAYRPVSGVEAGLSYSFLHSGFKTFGLALHLGSIFYIAGDYIIPHVNSDFIPTTSKAINIQFGFAIPIGSKH